MSQSATPIALPVSTLSYQPSTWLCDACQQPIQRPEDGWVEWLTRPDPTGQRTHRCRSLRLVHHLPASPRPGGCYHDEEAEQARDGSSISDMHLSTYLGPDGLMELLLFLNDQTFDDPAEVLELIKRLHAPLYEHARPYLKDYLGEEFFPGEIDFPRVEDMVEAIRWGVTCGCGCIYGSP